MSSNKKFVKALRMHSLVVIAVFIAIETLILTMHISRGIEEGNYLRMLLSIFALVTCILALVLLFINTKRNYFMRRELEISNEKYHSVVNNVKEIIFQTDADGRWIFLNPMWTEITGYTIEESLGTCFLDYVYEEDKKRVNERFMNVMSRRDDFRRILFRSNHKQGGCSWVEVHARLMLDKQGRITGTIGTVADISHRKLMEEEDKKRDKLLKTIAEMANTLLATSNIYEAFEKSLSMLGEAANVDRVYIFKNEPVSTPEGEEIMARVLFEWCRDYLVPQKQNKETYEVSYKFFEPLQCYEKLSAGSGLKINIKELPEVYQNFFGLMQVKAIMNVPIFIENKFWGIIGFDDCHDFRDWTESEESILHLAATSIEGAIKRRTAEEALQDALQDDFRQTVRNLHNLVFKVKKNENLDICFTLFEGKAARSIDIENRLKLNTPIQEILSGNWRDYIRDYAEQAFRGHTTNFDFSIGGRHFLITLSPIIKNKIVTEVVGTAIDITDHKMAEEKIKYMAYYDNLTGLPNRTLLQDRINIAASHANRSDSMTALLFLDLDRFKVINDTLGHNFGDLLLKEVAKRLKECVREDDTVSRLGGDEFAILLTEVKDDMEVSQYAEKIIDLFKDPFIIEGKEIFISTSIGISMYPIDGRDTDVLSKNADTAMYRAKDSGRNTFQFYANHMNERALEKLTIETSLRKAVEKKEFFLLYQPKVDMTTGRIVGSEALIRWKHFTMGTVSPAEFIPLAEDTGLIVPIGTWVLREACRQNKLWQEAGYKNLTIAVNISARQFQAQNIHDIVAVILEETGLDPQYLDLEITENIIMNNSEAALNSLYKLKEMGVKISIDDFGTGFSSLSYLKKFNTDCLKIDQSFIRDINTDGNSEAITTAIISMAHDLKLKVVAEGVETQEQLNFLKEHNCDEMQGYFFSRPIESSDFENLLSKNQARE